MEYKKLFWLAVLFLFLITSIPQAHSQTCTGECTRYNEYDTNCHDVEKTYSCEKTVIETYAVEHCSMQDVGYKCTKWGWFRGEWVCKRSERECNTIKVTEKYWDWGTCHFWRFSFSCRVRKSRTVEKQECHDECVEYGWERRFGPYEGVCYRRENICTYDDTATRTYTDTFQCTKKEQQCDHVKECVEYEEYTINDDGWYCNGNVAEYRDYKCGEGFTVTESKNCAYGCSNGQCKSPPPPPPPKCTVGVVPDSLVITYDESNYNSNLDNEANITIRFDVSGNGNRFDIVFKDEGNVIETVHAHNKHVEENILLESGMHAINIDIKNLDCGASISKSLAIITVLDSEERDVLMEGSTVIDPSEGEINNLPNETREILDYPYSSINYNISIGGTITVLSGAAALYLLTKKLKNLKPFRNKKFLETEEGYQRAKSIYEETGNIESAESATSYALTTSILDSIQNRQDNYKRYIKDLYNKGLITEEDYKSKLAISAGLSAPLYGVVSAFEGIENAFSGILNMTASMIENPIGETAYFIPSFANAIGKLFNIDEVISEEAWQKTFHLASREDYIEFTQSLPAIGWISKCGSSLKSYTQKWRGTDYWSNDNGKPWWVNLPQRWLQAYITKEVVEKTPGIREITNIDSATYELVGKGIMRLYGKGKSFFNGVKNLDDTKGKSIDVNNGKNKVNVDDTGKQKSKIDVDENNKIIEQDATKNNQGDAKESSNKASPDENNKVKEQKGKNTDESKQKNVDDSKKKGKNEEKDKLQDKNEQKGSDEKNSNKEKDKKGKLILKGFAEKIKDYYANYVEKMKEYWSKKLKGKSKKEKNTGHVEKFSESLFENLERLPEKDINKIKRSIDNSKLDFGSDGIVGPDMDIMTLDKFYEVKECKVDTLKSKNIVDYAKSIDTKVSKIEKMDKAPGYMGTRLENAKTVIRFEDTIKPTDNLPKGKTIRIVEKPTLIVNSIHSTFDIDNLKSGLRSYYEGGEGISSTPRWDRIIILGEKEVHIIRCDEVMK